MAFLKYFCDSGVYKDLAVIIHYFPPIIFPLTSSPTLRDPAII